MLYLLAFIACSIFNARAYVVTWACGSNLQAELNSQMTSLIITGSGDMQNWESASKVPWSKNDYITYVEVVSLPEGLTSIGNYAFAGCNKLRGIIIPNNVSRIGTKAFTACTKLPAISLQGGVNEIGELAFANCSSLKTVTIGANVTVLGKDAFYGCTAITSIYNYSTTPQTIANKSVFPNSIKSTCILYVPEESVDLYSTAAEWSGFTIRAIPEDSNNIIDFGTANEDGSLTWKLTNDSSIIIEGNGAMTAFKYYGIDPQWKGYRYYVAKLYMSDGLTSIGGEAFLYFENLVYVTIPETVTYIGELAFAACEKLSYLCIPKGVESIVGGAFYGCTSLTTLIISESVNSIGTNAFYYCVGLKDIYNYSVTPQVISENVFYMLNKTNCRLYVPQSSINLYTNAEVWRDFYILPIPGSEESTLNVFSENAVSNKILRNGQILILRGEKVFTLQGQEVR